MTGKGSRSFLYHLFAQKNPIPQPKPHFSLAFSTPGVVWLSLFCPRREERMRISHRVGLGTLL